MNFDINHPDNVTETQWVTPPAPKPIDEVGMGLEDEIADAKAQAALRKKRHKKPKRVRKIFDREGAKVGLLGAACETPCASFFFLAPTPILRLLRPRFL